MSESAGLTETTDAAGTTRVKRLIERFSGGKTNVVIVPVFVVLALFVVATTHYGTRTLSAVRAYIGAESLWTKAQKEATSLLSLYVLEQQPELYGQFEDRLEFHRGLRRSRETLVSDAPDQNLAIRGFQNANIHSDDIELILWLARFRTQISYIERAYELWREGDGLITELRVLAGDIQQIVQAGRMDDELRHVYIREIVDLDQRLTEVETAFTAVLADGARVTHAVQFWLTISIGVFLVVLGYLVTGVFFRKVNRLNRDLRESESRFRTVLQHSQDVIYELDLRTWLYDYMSPAIETMLGYSVEEVLAGGPDFLRERIHPKDREYMEQQIRETRSTDGGTRFLEESEFRIRRSDGSYIWVNNHRTPVMDGDGSPVAIVGSVREVSARKLHEKQLEKSLEEKRTLLAEIHHRVKNNLAIVSSLLALQRNEGNPELCDVLQNTESRIRSIAMIHEKLYQTDTFADVDMKEYIGDFVAIVAESYASTRKTVTVLQDIDRIRMDITRAVPLGLMLNELLTNAYKHGFADADAGELTISLKRRGGDVVLRVTNDGSRLPADFSFDGARTLGMTLLQTLTSQLYGTIEVVQNGVTTFKLTFPAT